MISIFSFKKEYLFQNLIYILFYCRMAPCQLHIIQKERSEAQPTGFLFVCLQKEDVKPFHDDEVLGVRSFQCNFGKQNMEGGMWKYTTFHQHLTRSLPCFQK